MNPIPNRALRHARRTRPAGPARRRLLGASLVEAMLVLTITGTLAGSVLPGWSGARERRELDAASAQLATDLHLARSLAVSQGTPVRLSFTEGQACYVMHHGPSGACRCSDDGEAVCAADAMPLRQAVLPGQGRIALDANVHSMLFDADRGTVTPTATLRLERRDGAAIHHVVNIMGRARTCSPEGRVAGHARC